MGSPCLLLRRPMIPDYKRRSGIYAMISLPLTASSICSSSLTPLPHHTRFLSRRHERYSMNHRMRFMGKNLSRFLRLPTNSSNDFPLRRSLSWMDRDHSRLCVSSLWRWTRSHSWKVFLSFRYIFSSLGHSSESLSHTVWRQIGESISYETERGMTHSSQSRGSRDRIGDSVICTIFPTAESSSMMR